MRDIAEEAAQRCDELVEQLRNARRPNAREVVSPFAMNSVAAQAANLIQSIMGPHSAYSEMLANALTYKPSLRQSSALAGVIHGFRTDLANGRLINIRHEVETVVVTEILDQAKTLVQTTGVHPAAVVIVACAGAEEFLRTWCSELSIIPPQKQRSMSRYAAELRKAGKIELPIERRIQSWADYRNDAAHGDKWHLITEEISTQLLSEIENFLIANQSVLG